MLNIGSLVGMLTAEPSTYDYEDGGKVMIFYLAVKRLYRSPTTGKVEADFIRCKLWDKKTKILVDHCKKGDIVGFTGRLSSKKVEKEDGSYYNEQYFSVNSITLFPKAMNELPKQIDFCNVTTTEKISSTEEIKKIKKIEEEKVPF